MTVIDMTNYVAEKEQPFEDFIKEQARKITKELNIDYSVPIEGIISILEDTFDEGVGMGYGLMAEDILELFEEKGV